MVIKKEGPRRGTGAHYLELPQVSEKGHVGESNLHG
jgi:hypothetical protein